MLIRNALRYGIGPAPPEPYDYIIINDATRTIVMANSDATLSGKQIAVAATAVLTSGWNIYDRTFTTRTRIFGQTGAGNPNNMPIVQGSVDLRGNTNLTFEGIDVVISDKTAAGLGNLTGGTSNINLIIKRNKITGVPWTRGAGDMTDPTYADSRRPGPGAYGITFPGDDRVANGIEILDNEVSYFNEGIKFACKTGAVVIRGNYSHHNYSDQLHLGRIPGLTFADNPSSVYIGFNVCADTMSKASDAGNPHADGIQVTGGSGVDKQVPWPNVTIECNIIIPGPIQPSITPIQLSDIEGAGRQSTWKVRYNIAIHPGDSTEGATFTSPENGFCWGNVGVRDNPGTGGSAVTLFYANIVQGGDNFVGGNFFEAYDIGAGVGTDGSDITLLNSEASYEAQFPLLALGMPTTAAEAIARIGSHARFAGVNWAAQTVDDSYDPPGLVFPARVDCTASTLSWSAPSQVKSGSALTAVEAVAGSSWKYDDDGEGTGESAVFDSGDGELTFARGKFLYIGAVSDPDQGDTVIAEVLVNGLSQTCSLSTDIVVEPTLVWDETTNAAAQSNPPTATDGVSGFGTVTFSGPGSNPRAFGWARENPTQNGEYLMHAVEITSVGSDYHTTGVCTNDNAHPPSSYYHPPWTDHGIGFAWTTGSTTNAWQGNDTVFATVTGWLPTVGDVMVFLTNRTGAATGTVRGLIIRDGLVYWDSGTPTNCNFMFATESGLVAPFHAAHNGADATVELNGGAVKTIPYALPMSAEYWDAVMR